MVPRKKPGEDSQRDAASCCQAFKVPVLHSGTRHPHLAVCDVTELLLHLVPALLLAGHLAQHLLHPLLQPLHACLKLGAIDFGAQGCFASSLVF